jgi:integrase
MSAAVRLAGNLTVPKGGRRRHVPMSARLVEELKDHRHLRSPRVVCRADGSALTQWMVRDYVERAARHGGVPIAGHQDIRTTQRYMHLSPAGVENTIRWIDQLQPSRGEILETTPEVASK